MTAAVAKKPLEGHAEWLQLVQVNGPFVSIPVLKKLFPQGLDKPDDEADVARRLKQAHAEWRLASGVRRRQACGDRAMG